MMVSHSEAFGQTQPTILLPNELNGKVQLDISTIPNLNVEKLSYEYLSIFIKNEREEYGSNAVQGRYTIEKNYLIFSPFFPFEKGMNYIARTKNDEGSYTYQSFQTGKKDPVDEAKVVSIFPSANELPENLLRFYFYFNTPMKKGQALKHIQLVDAEGNIDKQAFMEFKQELWSADGTRLTVLFDPGRIKRGVSTNRELGPALLDGNKYQLIISDTWQDVYGQALDVKTTKEFTVVKAYRQQININGLEILKPKQNTDDTLSIHFDRIMDHALVQSMIRIEDENNMLIDGIWEASGDEKTIQFIPENLLWQNGKYQIIMDSRLEDIAGNNLNNLLDQKTGVKNSNNQKIIRHFSI